MLSSLYVKALEFLPPFLSILLVRAHNRISGQRDRFVIDGGKLVVIPQKGRPHSVSVTPRAFLDMVHGPKERGRRMKSRYLIDHIEGDIQSVIDVGANNGDLLLAMDDKVLQNYLGIEPILEDYQLLQENISGLGPRFTAAQLALGSEDSNLVIYVSRNGADSSLIEPASGYSEKRNVNVTTLESVYKNFFDKGQIIDFLKVEAEGYEPEVLQGSKRMLENVRYVAVDGGPERGTTRDTTIEACSNFLIGHGFELVKLEGRKGIGLFRNYQNKEPNSL